MADKVHVISRRCVVLTWMRANRKQMWHVTLWNNIKLTLHHENNDDDKVMCASVWCEVFGGLLQCPTPCYMGGKCDNKEGDLYIAHMFPRILGLERGSDITEDDIIFKGSNLIICPKHSLYMRLIDCTWVPWSNYLLTMHKVLHSKFWSKDYIRSIIEVLIVDSLEEELKVGLQ